MNDLQSPCWKIEDLVFSMRLLLKAQSAWSIHWVPRWLNQQAHLLVQWAARFNVYGLFDSSRISCCIPANILYCDSSFPAFS